MHRFSAKSVQLLMKIMGSAGIGAAVWFCTAAPVNLGP